MSEKGRSVVEDDEVDPLARNHPAKARDQPAQRRPSIGTGGLLVEEQRDVEIAVLSSAPPCAAAEEVR